MKPIKTSFSVALKYSLDKMGYGSQSKLARKLKISQPLINALMNGKSTGSEKNRRAIARFFSYDYDTFIKLGENILREEQEQQAYGAFDTGFTQEHHIKTGKILQAIAEYLQSLAVQASISYPGKITNQSQTSYDAIIELRSLLDSAVYDEVGDTLSHNEKCDIYFGKSEFTLEQAYDNREMINTDKKPSQFRDPKWGQAMDELLIDIEKDPELKAFIEKSITMLAERTRIKKKEQKTRKKA